MAHIADFFIVGAPKCGTTSLQRYLLGHPEVFIVMRPKEPQFFAADEAARFGMRYPDDLSHYEALFAAAGKAKRLGDASTSYLEAPEAPGRIHEFNPEARIIVMLRDPVAMMHSLHSMRVSAGLERMTDFSAALEDERRRPGFGQVGDQSSIRYRDRVRFSEMLPAWFETFGRERVHIVLLEDFAKDTAGEFRKVLEFLDVDPAWAPAEVHALQQPPVAAQHVPGSCLWAPPPPSSAARPARAAGPAGLARAPQGQPAAGGANHDLARATDATRRRAAT